MWHRGVGQLSPHKKKNRHNFDQCGGSSKSIVSPTDNKSGRPDSNRRRPAWEAGILPTELRPRLNNLPRGDCTINSRHPPLDAKSTQIGDSRTLSPPTMTSRRLLALVALAICAISQRASAQDAGDRA